MLFLRYLQQADQAVRNGGTSVGLCGREIRGKKVGIIGCGQIGSMTAKLFRAFGAEVYAYARHEREEVKAAGIAYKPLDDLLRECDIISLHTPNNKETRGMISAEKIALMKKSAIFINCARGLIVDSKALAQALNEGRIAGAAVDVFDCEPPIPTEEPLLHAKNTLLTPHVVGGSHGTQSGNRVFQCVRLSERKAGKRLYAVMWRGNNKPNIFSNSSVLFKKILL